MKYIFIINGRADKSDARNQLEQMLAADAGDAQYEIYPTTGSGDGTRYTRVYCDLHPEEEVCFVACGGDGTINEVASGLIGFKNKSLAVLAVGGTGNDFIKYYCGGDMKSGPDFKNVHDLLAGEERQIDIIKVNDNYSINVCNFGFDSVVASTANSRIARGKAKNAYRFGIIKAILTGRFNRIEVSADGEKLGGHRMLLCTLANNHYVGGEFFCAPRAKNDDGLIDVCYIRAMSLVGFLQILPIYTRGEHLDHPKYGKRFTYRQAKHVEVRSKNLIELCLDGEMLPGTKFDIDIIPQATTFRIPCSTSTAN